MFLINSTRARLFTGEQTVWQREREHVIKHKNHTTTRRLGHWFVGHLNRMESLLSCNICFSYCVESKCRLRKWPIDFFLLCILTF